MGKSMMDEQNQKNTRQRIIIRIFKWIGLIVLVLLIILGLIFEAPWKVITLFLIILAACTILPKPYRKWFWLSAGAVVIALIIWVFLPEDDEGWRPYTFDEELAAIQAKHTIPDEENAATIYNELLQDFDVDTFYANVPVNELQNIPIREPWLSKDHPELAKWLKDNENTITKLLEASKIEKCMFRIIDPEYFETQINRNSIMRRWAFFLVSAVNNDIAEGHTEESLQKNLAILQMGKHLRQQSTMIDMLVGIAIEALATNQFNRFVISGDATEERLSVIEEALADIKHDWSYDLPRILEGEKLMIKNTFCSLVYEINQEGKVRFTRDPTAVIREQFPEEMPPPTFWQRKLAKAGAILACLGMPSTPKEVSKNIDSGFQRLYAMAEPDFDWAGSPKEFNFNPMKVKFNWIYLTRIIADMMASMLEEPCYRIHDSYLRNIAEQRGARIIIALRRCKNKTGHWPKSLDEIKSQVLAEILIDPLNNSSFVYKITDDGFTLYSKGQNNIDEAGEYKYNSKWQQEPEPDDWLIWPKKLPKTQEEKTDDEQQ